MRIATFNCNSVRMRLPIILDWLREHRPDALALQETKAEDVAFPRAEFEAAGWRVAFCGEKSYNGVAVVTQEEPERVSFGLLDDAGESRTRLAHLRYRGVELVNAYVPQGQALDSDKFKFKLDWFARFKHYCDRFDFAKDKVVWVGDLNVAPAPADVHDSKAVWPHVCHCAEVIAAFKEVTELGFTDVFRKHLPQPGVFTFWDYRVKNALARGLGWRIDHVLASPAIAKTSSACIVDLEPRKREKPSDHTFVAADFDL